VPDYLAYVLKKFFPEISVNPARETNKSDVMVNSDWIGTVGKTFKLEISMWTDKKGNIHVPGEEDRIPAISLPYFVR
jgi:hypothetical protein